MADRINVTKTHLPSLEEYQRMIGEIWDSGQLTNYGEKAVLLREKLIKHLDIDNLQLVNNGTIAIQLAIKALELQGDIITTPFSYVATVSSVVWEGCNPVFVDISETDYCIDSNKIEAAITPNTSAILATHVYGNPCDVHEIQAIADKHGLKVIYDAAHAFDVKIDGKSILCFGDVSTLSFHATNIFHTGEGGAVVTADGELAHKMAYLGNFGHKSQEDFWGLGVNSKMSEIHAALGLCVLPEMQKVIACRRQTVNEYDALLANRTDLKLMSVPKKVQHNYSYYPVLFSSEIAMLKVRDALNDDDIHPRRYFYPSLNKLPYLAHAPEMPIAESVSSRILCLPLSSSQTKKETERICSIILSNL